MHRICVLDWMLFAIGSAFFAGITSILAKIGVRSTDSTVATALRTIVVLAFSWAMVLMVGSLNEIGSISAKTAVFLILSGLATGASWLCCFKALQLGDVNKVVPVDKSSILLTVLFAVALLGESLSILGAIGLAGIAVGTFMMIEKKDVEQTSEHMGSWLLFAIGSAVFAAMTSILGKVGITDIESNLGTAIRTIVVLAMSWMMIFVIGKQDQLRSVPKRDLIFIVASGFATGASWLCFYHALQIGPASLVVPIDKLSILVTIAFSVIVLHEGISKKSFLGLLMIVVGTLLMMV